MLRFILSMWEDMGERNLRKLEKLGILKLPSKRHLERLKANTPSGAGCTPEAFDMLRNIVRGLNLTPCALITNTPNPKS